jgi:hypothetical protein
MSLGDALKQWKSGGAPASSRRVLAGKLHRKACPRGRGAKTRAHHFLRRGHDPGERRSFSIGTQTQASSS